jgi:hypothetical protein
MIPSIKRLTLVQTALILPTVKIHRRVDTVNDEWSTRMPPLPRCTTVAPRYWTWHEADKVGKEELRNP